MARKNECYADTSAFIAFLDRSDSYHSAFLKLFSEPPALVTSALVIAEGHAWFLRRYDGRRAVQFLTFLDTFAPLTVASFGSVEASAAGAIVRRYAGQKLTLADAHGLAIMRDRKITSCWSTDRHLGLMGVPLVV